MDDNNLYGSVQSYEDYIEKAWKLNNFLIDKAIYFIENEYKVYFPLFNTINNSSENGLKEIFTKFYIFYKSFYIQLGWKYTNDLQVISELVSNKIKLQPVLFEIEICNKITQHSLLLNDTSDDYILSEDSYIVQQINTLLNNIAELINLGNETITYNSKPNFVVQIDSASELQKFKFNR